MGRRGRNFTCLVRVTEFLTLHPCPAGATGSSGTHGGGAHSELPAVLGGHGPRGALGSRRAEPAKAEGTRLAAPPPCRKSQGEIRPLQLRGPSAPKRDRKTCRPQPRAPGSALRRAHPWEGSVRTAPGCPALSEGWSPTLSPEQEHSPPSPERGDTSLFTHRVPGVLWTQPERWAPVVGARFPHKPTRDPSSRPCCWLTPASPSPLTPTSWSPRGQEASSQGSGERHMGPASAWLGLLSLREESRTGGPSHRKPGLGFLCRLGA